MISRERAADLGRETVVILQAGFYRAPSGRDVSIQEDLERAVQGSVLHAPDTRLRETPLRLADAPPTRIEVTDESTLTAARRLVSASPGCDPCCLNFASARNPGGGFLSGARAQEEALSRSSGLYACISPMRQMYDYNRARPTCLYSDYMIYSPQVPVIRDDEGVLLEEPYRASMLTAAAVNAGAVREDEVPQIESTMRKRAARVLAVCRHHGHATLVLGAWGCGAFRNDPVMVANLFAELLGPGGEFHNVFEHVVFAVLYYSKNVENYEAFRDRFASF